MNCNHKSSYKNLHSGFITCLDCGKDITKYESVNVCEEPCEHKPDDYMICELCEKPLKQIWVVA